MSDAWGTLTVPAHADAAPSLDMSVADDAIPAQAIATSTDPHLVRRYRQYAMWCGYLVTAIGSVALLGWFTDAAVLTSIRLQWTTMKANTAVGLTASGYALCLNVSDRGSRALAVWASRLCAAFTIILASATLAESMFDIDLGIDQLLVVELPGAVGTAHPGRIPPISGMSFAVCGLSLLTIVSGRRGWQMVSSALALLATVVSMLVLLGYVFGAPELYTVSGRFSAVAANTSIAFLALGIGILFANLPAGPLHRLASFHLGGMMLRRMLPVAIVMPTTIIWLRLIAHSAGLFDSNEFGAATVAAIMMISLVCLLVWHAGVLDRLDVARRHGDEQINRLNAALNARVLALEAANREFQGFSYSMSHVLRAPLRAIHGYAQVLLEEVHDKLGDEGLRLIGVIQSSTEEMSELLDGILAFLRLGWQPMTIVPVDMRHHVRAAIGQLEGKIAGRTIRFDIGDLPGTQADALMIQRVWLNLLDNAIKFTSRKDAARIEVGAQNDGDKTVYFVKDNGAGFDMQYVAKLFGVFQRLHDAAQFPGTGIGLAIVNRIVARHGGRVWANSGPDEGAAFYFSLPLTEKMHV